MADNTMEIINDNGVMKVRQTVVQEQTITPEFIYKQLIDLGARKNNLQLEINRIDTDIIKYNDMLIQLENVK